MSAIAPTVDTVVIFFGSLGDFVAGRSSLVGSCLEVPGGGRKFGDFTGGGKQVHCSFILSSTFTNLHAAFLYSIKGYVAGLIDTTFSSAWV